MKTLFAAQAADGQSATFAWDGGRGTFTAWGTFGSGTVKLQMSPDGGSTWIDMLDVNGNAVSETANGMALFELAAGVKIRADLSGSTSPTINTRIH